MQPPVQCSHLTCSLVTLHALSRRCSLSTTLQACPNNSPWSRAGITSGSHQSPCAVSSTAPCAAHTHPITPLRWAPCLRTSLRFELCLSTLFPNCQQPCIFVLPEGIWAQRVWKGIVDPQVRVVPLHHPANRTMLHLSGTSTQSPQLQDIDVGIDIDIDITMNHQNQGGSLTAKMMSTNTQQVVQPAGCQLLAVQN